MWTYQTCNRDLATDMSVATLPRRAVLAAIRFYQTRISPLTPPSCRFHPTCSHYTGEAIERFGLVRGGVLGAIRICKCHPLHRGGFDPVPEEFVLINKSKARPDADALPNSSHDTTSSFDQDLQ